MWLHLFIHSHKLRRLHQRPHPLVTGTLGDIWNQEKEIMSADRSVITVDCHYVAPEKAAAYLLIEQGHAAFVDNNTAHAVPHLLAALKAEGLGPEAVDYLIVTHIHLDHSGGTAELLKHCPNATVLAHPKAARHLIDPSRLVASAKKVYGEEAFQHLYGEIEPVPEARVQIMQDDEVIDWHGRPLRFLYTRGHANHHFVVYDEATRSVISGDSFGIGRTRLVRPGKSFIACSSSPPEFDPEEARQTVQRILDTGAERVFITHFGEFPEIAEGAAQLLRSITALEAIVEAARQSSLEGADLRMFCIDRGREAMRAHLEECGVDDVQTDLDWLEGDIAVNGMGLAVLAERRRKTSG
jgi:glyoxylase-like metal-dependent hydrolase (beta-lactamase superfamily II)